MCDDGVCQLEPELGTTPPATCDDAPVWYSYFVGRFVNICAVAGFGDHGAWSTDATRCRLAVCDSDDDCPVLLGREYACRARLCQRSNGSNELDNIDVTSLCFGATPRPTECIEQIEDPEVRAVFELVDERCPVAGGACSVPASCHQP
ncbi:Hypothetical protein A7982_05374 [Minicystis rosea]|nr:Hypothetical protein A7982_05374 [Minicystis rosea]